jgi:hypothetical protein
VRPRHESGAGIVFVSCTRRMRSAQPVCDRPTSVDVEYRRATSSGVHSRANHSASAMWTGRARNLVGQKLPRSPLWPGQGAQGGDDDAAQRRADSQSQFDRHGSAPCSHLWFEGAEAGAGAMLVACRLAGLSALETYYARLVTLTQLGASGPGSRRVMNPPPTAAAATSGRSLTEAR